MSASSAVFNPVAAPPVTYDFVPSWYLRLRSRLFEQFKKSATWDQWCQLLGQQADDIEAAGQTLFTLLDVNNSYGANLDVIGRIVGQPRGASADDPTYRLYINARIAANRSTGTANDIIGVLTAFLLGFQVVIATCPIGVKTFTATLAYPPNHPSGATTSEVAAALTFLAAAKDAGARAILAWRQTPSSQSFRFDTGPGFDVGLFRGAKDV